MRRNITATTIILLIVVTCVTSFSLARRRGRVHFGGHRVVYAAPYHFGAGYYGRHFGVSYFGSPFRARHYPGPAVGRVDFNVRPQQSQIFVDGAYIGVADDFNGYPQTAALPAGKHRIRVVAPDGRTIDREIYVMPYRELNFNHKF